MDRRIVVIGVPSNIGIKPYDDGRARGVDRPRADHAPSAGPPDMDRDARVLA